MRKSFFVLLALMVLVGMFYFSHTPSSQAQGRYGHYNSRQKETSGILTDANGNSMDYAVWIYSANIYADAASSFVGFYDADTQAEVNTAVTNVATKDEIGEATQYDCFTKVYATPQYYSDGVWAIMTVGVASVEYGPEPE
jgi:hypothetical protein